MVRSKVKYELIADERMRRETFRKRKAGFFKKLDELKTLCNAEVCGVMISGDGAQSEVWPTAQEASRVIQRFTSLPLSSQTGHMVDQAGFIRQNLNRITRNLDKENMKADFLEKELVLAKTLATHDAGGMALELGDMLCFLDTRMDAVNRVIAEMEPADYANVAGPSKKATYEGKGKRPL